MHKRLTIALLIVISGFANAAEETNAPPSPKTDDRPSITTRSGLTYERCTIRRVESDGINIIHSKGIARIAFSELPDEYQKRYGYDPNYAGQFSVAQAKANIAQLDGKVIQLSFESVADIIETQGGYETTMFNSIFRSADDIGISARFPGLAAAWLSSLPKTGYRHEGRLSTGDVFTLMNAKKNAKKNAKAYSVFGKITGTEAIRFEPLGIKRTGNKYSW